jgi:hypothetical protein
MKNTIEIHNSFDTTSNELYRQAKEILKYSNHDAELQKAVRLKGLGFVNSVETKVLKSIDYINEDKVLFPFTIKYYNETYPFLKFLTEEKLKELCVKHNLCFAPVENYLGTIPDKNLNEIERAQLLLEKDTPNKRYFMKVMTFWDYDGKNSVNSRIKEHYKNWVQYDGRINKWEERWQRGISEISDVSSYLNRKLNLTEKETRFVVLKDIVVEAFLTNLYICSSEDTFVDLDTLIKEDNNSYYKPFELEKPSEQKLYPKIKDPIVFRFVKGGGVQILSKWGDESNEEELINPTDN